MNNTKEAQNEKVTVGFIFNFYHGRIRFRCHTWDLCDYPIHHLCTDPTNEKGDNSLMGGEH